ncbi:PEPxxWA-CTERM sorting domain-containing protein [Sphingomonas sp. MMS24-J13]|uniref:PEPxxWA-CTERM sorting domain-containing protein n=1 Tax=Sphingomonas sp. MMS24-J13 TaxID=3238686 RepID=UPI00384B0D1A
MKRLVGLVFALGAIFTAMPASAAMLYGLAGTFSGKLTTHLSTTPVTRNFDNLDLAFVGVSDGSAATLSHVGGVDVYSFSLAVLVITDGNDELDLTGFSFVAAPSIDLIGFRGPQGLLFSVTLPTSFDGTSLYVPTGFSDIVASQAVTAGDRRLKLSHVDGANGAFVAFDPVLLSGVPEASSWAMFILGFGAIGAGLRRRRAPVTIAA